MAPVSVALTVSGLLGVKRVDGGRIGQRPLCRGQIDCKNAARVSQTNDREGS